MNNLENLTTQFLGRNILWYDKLESTQKLAHELIKENLPNGSVIITKNQTNGIGTNGRSWYSEPDINLTFTMVLYSNCDIKKLENITIEIAETIVKIISDFYDIKLNIKHPNDLICNGKKTGGILTESKTRGNIITELVIGIGLDINGKQMPPELENIATSLKIEYQKDFNIKNIFVEFLNRFEEIYLSKLRML